jgi:hypothetical protein
VTDASGAPVWTVTTEPPFSVALAMIEEASSGLTTVVIAVLATMLPLSVAEALTAPEAGLVTSAGGAEAATEVGAMVSVMVTVTVAPAPAPASPVSWGASDAMEVELPEAPF